MKKSYYLLFILACCSLFACNKTISNDDPLPIVYKPNVLVPTTTGILYSFDAETGLKNWEYNSGISIESTPVMDKAENIYFGNNFGQIHAVDAKTGKQKWTKFLAQYNSSSPCIGDDGKLYVGADSLYCLDVANGNKLWRVYLGGNIKTAPTFKNGNIFVAVGQKIFSINSTNTVLNWTYDAGSSEFSSPTVRDGKVYAGLENGRVICVDEFLGTQIWSYTCNGDVNSTPMVRGDMCIVGSYDDTIRCIDAVAGTDAIRWKLATTERVSSSATIDVDRETVYIGSNDFNLYAINHVNGKLRWKFPTGSIIRSSPVLYNNKIYFTSFDKYMYCVDVNTGKLVWKVNTNSLTQSLASPIINATNATAFYPTVSGNSIH